MQPTLSITDAPIPRLMMWVVLLLLAGLGAGCTTILSAQVTSFHRSGETFSGKRFEIVPDDRQRGQLEFDAYARQVGAALAAQGLVPAQQGSAQLRVRIDYAVDAPRAVAYEQPVYGYANVGPVWGLRPHYGPGGVVYQSWGWSYPLAWGVVGSSVGQYRVWRHRLEVRIEEASADAPKLFEGSASSSSRTDALPTLMPVLVHALFEKFPGPNGETRTVDVEVREAPER